MSCEISAHQDERVSAERNIMPPRVNFKQIAQNALDGGIFVMDREARGRNKDLSREYSTYPTGLLHAPYGNGPMVIERFEEDIPEDIVFAVRKNFIAANKLLLPTEQVLQYFHQQFYDGEIFTSDTLEKIVDDYSPRSVGADKTLDPSLSFQTEGVDRKVHDRTLYTEEEEIASLELAYDHPEVVLTILMYQSILQDYFQELREEFVAVAQLSKRKVTAKNLEDYDVYARQWANSNFTNELIPALAIFYHQKKEANPTKPKDQIIDQQVFHNAVEFTIANGAFRNWVEVPAHVALDGKERTNHFLCPALGTVRDQILDGSLLHKIYTTINKKIAENDIQVGDYADIIQTKASERIAEGEQEPISMEEIERLYEEYSKVTIKFDDTEYTVKVDDHFSSFMQGEQQPGDIIIEPRIGSFISDAMRKAAITAIEQNTPVFFDFNDEKYRLTPEKVKESLQTMGELKDPNNR